ncbi:MAG: protein kinase [Desulfobacteraceae bacterium]|nr:protein kinase [Desulfobacteraceae bacterium]
MRKRLFTDTTNYFGIDYGDIIEVGGRQYIIKGHEREARFGLDEPKFWVKKAIEADTGERKIIKLSFFESFETNIGGLMLLCFRHPEKEAAVLDLVGDHPHFMHGISFNDEKGNNVRVIDIVNGKSLYHYIEALKLEHEEYFLEHFPGILKNLITAFESLGFLHKNGFRHGDVRNDHIYIEKETGNYVWIDFDYDYQSSERPFSLDIMGVGNILLYTAGMGFHNLNEKIDGELVYKDLINRVEPEDFSILHKWRFMNLRKLYPYIPVELNNVLAHFTAGSDVFYDSVEEILEDLDKCV